MCGLVGVVGDIGDTEKKAFKLLLHFDTLRGPHSTGVISIDKQNKSDWVKKAGTPYELFADSPKFDGRGLWTKASQCLIGHNRYATTGEINTKNAHPFEQGSITGVHNGTLEVASFRDFINADKTFEVDSDGMFASIDKVGLKDTIGNIRGAWSLIYYDKKKQSINFLRNSQRPMCYAVSKRKALKEKELPVTIFFASEPWMIEQACDLTKIPIDKVQSTISNVHYSAELGKRNYNRKGVKFTAAANKLESKAIPYYPNTPYQGYLHNGQRAPIESLKDYQIFQGCQEENGKTRLFFIEDEVTDNGAYSVKFALCDAPSITGRMYFEVNLRGEKAQELKERLIESDGWYTNQIMTWVSSSDEMEMTCNSANLTREMKWEDYPWTEDQLKAIDKNVEKLEAIDKKSKAEWDKEEADKMAKEVVVPIKKKATTSLVTSGLNEDFPSLVDALKRREDSIDYVKGTYLSQENWEVDILVEGPNGEYLGKEDFETIISQGCSYCSGNETIFEEHEEIKWLSDGTDGYLCKGCVGLKEHGWFH